jgi:Fur family ferric uptake transcriptional regulator
VDCGRVEEFSDASIEARQHEAASRLGFDLADHALILYGHCRRPNCVHKPRG